MLVVVECAVVVTDEGVLVLGVFVLGGKGVAVVGSETLVYCITFPLGSVIFRSRI
jgi:hypothetical protein